mmetsp:Transcript_18896/g.24557  ORF Transcript_18896/g.24557 Transcript_18896/m.24557 type:complete len:289 (+) Transcript_18896:561-1427(+)
MHIGVGIIRFDNFKTTIFEALDNFGSGSERGETISNLYSFFYTNMIFVITIITPFWKYDPFISNKDATFFKTVSNSGKSFHAIRRVTSSLNSIRCVKRLGFKNLLQLLEVTLHKLTSVGESFLRVVFVTNLDLIFVDGNSSDTGLGMLGNITKRTSYSTSYIQNFIPLAESSRSYEKILTTLNRFHKSLTNITWGKMKRLSPTIFIKVRDQIVKTIHHGLVLLFPRLNTLIRCNCTILLPSTIKQLLVPINTSIHPIPLQNRILVVEHGHGIRVRGKAGMHVTFEACT